MRFYRYYYVLLALLGALPLHAQSPVITPKGDPSIRNDTLYSLTVDSLKHPEETVVLLLDDGVVRVEKDGTGTRTYRMIGQILRQQAVETWSEFTFSYNADREQFVLNWARVVGADGKVLSPKPIHVQEMDAPVAEQSPVYTNHKIVRISLANVAPGTIVDYSYTTIVKKPILSGDFSANWRITTGGTVRRSRMILDAPAGMAVKIDARNLDFEPIVQTVGGRKITTWSRADITRIEPEVFAADSNDITQHFSVVGSVGWQDVAQWYAGLARRQYALPSHAASKLAPVYAGAHTRLDSLRAAHRWVTQDVRYISLALGEGSYQPRPASDVIETMSGDCKDKTTLFVALARALGFEAQPVLVASEGKMRPALPSVTAFDHVIAAVKIGEGWTYVDVTADLVPFGAAMPGMLGENGLLVRDDGSFDVVLLPDYTPAESVASFILKGSVDEHGKYTGYFSRRARGITQFGLRSDFAETLTAKQIVEVAAATAQQLIEGASGDSLRISRGFDLDVEPFVDLKITAENVLKPAAQGFLFYLPILKYASPQLLAQLEREPARRFPFDAAQVFGPLTVTHELELEIPAGWKASLPQNVLAESAFGKLESSYEQIGATVKIRRTMRGTDAVLPASAKGELLSWLRALGRDDATFIILQPPSAVARPSAE